MESINWTPDMESCLFYAMMDHKPVGMCFIIFAGVLKQRKHSVD